MSDSLLNRRELVFQLIQQCGDAAVITGLGSPTYDVAAAGDREQSFYLWGAMGGAVMLGLGVALAQPERRVLVITGDAEALMGVGSFATVAAQRAANLAVLVLDNERFGETGGQASLTSQRTDLAAMAKGAGIETTLTINDSSHVNTLLDALLHQPGPVVAVAKINLQDEPRVLPPREGAYLHHRFRQAMGHTPLST